MKKRPPLWGRRKFLKTGASGSLLILTFPVLRLFSRFQIKNGIAEKTPDFLDERVRKYGAEFGGREAIQNIRRQRGGENGCF